MAIRWTKGQQAKLRKAVDTFRKKVERYSKSDIAEALPAVPKIRELKKQLSSAKELNALVKDLRAFSTGANKGKPQIYVNPQGVKMTEWERQRVNKAVEIVNKQKQERIEKLESGDVYDAEGNLIPDLKRVAKKYEEIKVKKRPEKVKTSKEWETFSKAMQEQMYKSYDNKRLAILQNNMVTALKSYWGREGKLYAQIIARMSMDDIKKAYEKDPDTFSPEFLYKRDVFDSSRKSDEETAARKMEKIIYPFANRKMSKDIINDELSRLKKIKLREDKKNLKQVQSAKEIVKAINDLDSLTIEQDLKAYYDVLNKSVSAEKKLEMLRAQKLI